MQQFQQEAHHEVGLGETPRCLIRKRCRYSSVEKFEDAFDTALDLLQKTQVFQDMCDEVQATLQLVEALVFRYCDLPVQCNKGLTDGIYFCPVSSWQVYR